MRRRGGEPYTEELVGKKGKCLKVIDETIQPQELLRGKTNTSRNSKNHAINIGGFQ